MKWWIWLGRADFLSISEDLLSVCSAFYWFPFRNWLQDHYYLVGRQKGQAGTVVSVSELLWLWAQDQWAGAVVLLVGCGTELRRAQSIPRHVVRLALCSYQWVSLANQTSFHRLSSTNSILFFAGIVRLQSFSVIPDHVPIQLSNHWGNSTVLEAMLYFPEILGWEI